MRRRIVGHMRTAEAQGLHCPLTEALSTTDCMNGEQTPGWYFAHVHGDLNRRILHMFEGTFSLDAAHIMKCTSNNAYFILSHNFWATTPTPSPHRIHAHLTNSSILLELMFNGPINNIPVLPSRLRERDRERNKKDNETPQRFRFMYRKQMMAWLKLGNFQQEGAPPYWPQFYYGKQWSGELSSINKTFIRCWNWFVSLLKGCTLKGRNSLPMGANSFLLE